MPAPWKILLGLGVLVLCLAAFLVTRTALFLSEAVRTEGTVKMVVVTEPLRRHSNRDREITTYQPHVRFVTPSGDEAWVTGMAGDPPEYENGEIVSVLYLAESPEDGRIDSFMELWLGAVGAGGVAALLLMFSFAAWRFEL
ncbi:DUF3592 domain-containing protein [Myxococcus sp. SDU36]|uniref:DUF3592 domain-containing protein n=1 Tax=Myxococcus sp. SDU36 TaxID=2831967 RepID=UPI0025430BCC|nr:DUF3592 domain-containing protein [Myxococcus sp. SDU36]WIG94048.1 DUF3592 domain-containing protein [Myxococcus sp. SDU36]